MDQDQRNYIDTAVERERQARIKAENDLLTERDRHFDQRIKDLERFYDQRFLDMEHAVKLALSAAKSGPPWPMVIGALIAFAVLIALLALTARGAI